MLWLSDSNINVAIARLGLGYPTHFSYQSHALYNADTARFGGAETAQLVTPVTGV